MSIVRHSISRWDTESSPAVGVQPDVSMNSVEFRIVIQLRSWKTVDSLSELCRMSKIPMELSSFIQEN